MKGHRIILALVMCAAAFAAHAQRDEGTGIYYGIKGGLMDPDNGDGLDPAINLGAMLGYNIPGITQLGGLVGVEGELTMSAVKGDVDGGGDWDVQTMAAYGTYRTGGAWYFKGKAGFAHQRVDFGAGDDKDTSASFGIGTGLKMGPGRAELEYTWLEDLNFISLAYIF